MSQPADVSADEALQRLIAGNERFLEGRARPRGVLRETLALVSGSGYRVGNVAVQVIGTRPRVAPRRDEVESRLTALVGAPVSLSATTSDGLGFTGRGEGLTAIATALLTS